MMAMMLARGHNSPAAGFLVPEVMRLFRPFCCIWPRASQADPLTSRQQLRCWPKVRGLARGIHRQRRHLPK